MTAETQSDDEEADGEAAEKAHAAAKAPRGSLTLKSAAALAVAFVASRLGGHLPVGAVQEVAGALVDLVFALGLLGVGVGRTRARGPIA